MRFWLGGCFVDPPLRCLQGQQCFPVIISWQWDTAQNNITLTPWPQDVPDAWGWGAPCPPQPLPLTGMMAPALAMGSSPDLPVGSPTVPNFCSTGTSLCHGSFKNCDFKLHLANFAELLGSAKKTAFQGFKMYKYCLYITLRFGIQIWRPSCIFSWTFRPLYLYLSFKCSFYLCLLEKIWNIINWLRKWIKDYVYVSMTNNLTFLNTESKSILKIQRNVLEKYKSRKIIYIM